MQNRWLNYHRHRLVRALGWVFRAQLCGLTLVLSTGLAFAHETHVIPSVEITAPAVPDTQIHSTETEQLHQQSSGETLGEYLDQLPNVDSASYGPAVGRPVIRGMEGYRVKILQNDVEVSDLSAMSHDHAVGVLPKASERIELLKGPASIVYGAHAGGAVRLIDQFDHHFPEPGQSGFLEAAAGSNNSLVSSGIRLNTTSENFTFSVSDFRNYTEDYSDGRGNRIADSDVDSELSQFDAGWRFSDSGNVFFGFAGLNKDYGIPNQTPQETRIDMQSDSYTLRVSDEFEDSWLGRYSVELGYVDYLHDETEGGRRDGLFGQKTASALLSLDYFHSVWIGKLLIGYRENELKVCHEHGACDRFTFAASSGINSNVGVSLENYLNDTGLPYSHGHPMPNTNSRNFMIGINGDRLIDFLDAEATLSLGAHLEFRDLQSDPRNIQETWIVPDRVDPSYYDDDREFAGSLSVGLEHPLGDRVTSQFNLSYLERLPSVDELFWNGFHHATDTYIFGDRDLKKERSINLDWDLGFSAGSANWYLGAFAYFFDRYTYQDQLFDEDGEPISDPFHLSDVWQTKQASARFTGLSVRSEWSLNEARQAPLVLTNQIDVIRATRSNGEKLPRTAPASWLIKLTYTPGEWSMNASVKRVMESSAAANETRTPAYTWVSANVAWRKTYSYGDWYFWLKGDNLGDSYAQNHLSFLKDSAPLMGRSVSAGIRLEF
ncbi:MAG: TonB-dependent receptor [Pseudomonadota bacterium]